MDTEYIVQQTKLLHVFAPRIQIVVWLADILQPYTPIGWSFQLQMTGTRLA